MPIRNETTRESYQPGRGFPRLGKLRPGDKKIAKSGASYPVDLDYFRVTFEPQYAHLEEAFRQLYGDQPKEFAPVYVMGRTADEAFPNWFEAYNSSATLLRRCDGVDMAKWLDESTGRHIQSPMPCVCDRLRADYERQIAGLSDSQIKAVKKPVLCSRVGRLNLLLPALMDATGVLGYLTAETGSRSNIQTIYQVLMDMERLLGTLQGVPFVFGRAPVEMNVNIDGERKKVTKALFYLRVTEEFTQREVIGRLAGFQSSAPALPAPRPALPATDELFDYEDDTPAPVQPGNGYLPVASLTVDWNEGDKFLTYVFALPNNEIAFYTGDEKPFVVAGLTSGKNWEPGATVTFNPPLLVKVKDAGAELAVVGMKPEYKGDVTVDRMNVKFP